MTLVSRDQLDARLHSLSIDRLVKSFSEMSDDARLLFEPLRSKIN